MTVVIDTNVILVANGQHEAVSSTCVAFCAARLLSITQSGRVAIDDGYRILQEYQNKTEPYAVKRAGDAFLKWLLRNNANPQHCDPIHLAEHALRGFESFPDDERLANFDPPDRKFVAVAAAHHENPPILQAADSKWLAWNDGLAAHGVSVEFLCPADITSQRRALVEAASRGQSAREDRVMNLIHDLLNLPESLFTPTIPYAPAP